jgi:hypothetical protein
MTFLQAFLQINFTPSRFNTLIWNHFFSFLSITGTMPIPTRDSLIRKHAFELASPINLCSIHGHVSPARFSVYTLWIGLA